jgi:cell division protein FtsB
MVWMQRQRERDRVGEDTVRLARETHELEAAVARVASGEGLEVIARQQLGLVRPDEIVYRFHQPRPS